MDHKESPTDEPLAYLFQVVEGPTYHREEHLPALQLLSQRFAGELWSYGAYEADLNVGRIRLRVVKDRYASRLRNFLHFRRAVLARVRELQATPPANLVATSYAPFKGGLLAWQVARKLEGAFLCEVNGQYGDPDNFAHVRWPWWRRARLLQMRL